MSAVRKSSLPLSLRWSRGLGDLKQMHIVEPILDALSTESNYGSLVGVEQRAGVSHAAFYPPRGLDFGPFPFHYAVGVVKKRDDSQDGVTNTHQSVGNIVSVTTHPWHTCVEDEGVCERCEVTVLVLRVPAPRDHDVGADGSSSMPAPRQRRFTAYSRLGPLPLRAYSQHARKSNHSPQCRLFQQSTHLPREERARRCNTPACRCRQ